MKYVFWVSGALLFYTFLGYPAWLYFASRWRSRPVRQESIQPAVSILMAVHNEAAALPAKLRNLQELNYPADRLDVVVVSDGSSDETNNILQAWLGKGRRMIILPANEGKGAALNRAVAAATGDIVVLTDARQLIEPDAVRFLVQNFADPSVGCASGELVLDQGGGDSVSAGLGLYWQWEKKIRQWESASGSVVGVTGALYAARKEVVPLLPPGIILDDVYVPLHAAGRGKRVIFESRAVSRDQLGHSGHEFWRKVRTLAGNYQLLLLAPWLLTGSNPIRFRLVSHKLVRLLVPFALLGVLASSIVLTSPMYRAVLASEVALVLCALLSAFRGRRGRMGPLLWISRLAEACSAFLVLNAAALVAFAYVASGRRVAWNPAMKVRDETRSPRSKNLNRAEEPLSGSRT